MAGTIVTTQQIQVTNGNNVFPASGGKLGVSNASAVQAASFLGGSPGEIIAISTGQGTLVDLSTISVVAGGGWAIFINEDATIPIQWGPDNGAGNIVLNGRMSPGAVAGPFETDPAQTKWRFRAVSGSPKMLAFFFPA
jgi:hypothetical protein